MRIKCCGITIPEDARYAETCGADAIGVVMFSPTSKRSVTMERAHEIFDAVGPFTTTVVVSHTTSYDDLEQILALHPDAIQISHPFVFRKKPAVKLIRVIGRNDPPPTDCDAIIVDDSHGCGKYFDLAHARNVVQTSSLPVILAGGLTPENVADAIRQVHPYAVDVATGIETAPGIKDHTKIAAFIAAARKRRTVTEKEDADNTAGSMPRENPGAEISDSGGSRSRRFIQTGHNSQGGVARLYTADETGNRQP